MINPLSYLSCIIFVLHILRIESRYTGYRSQSIRLTFHFAAKSWQSSKMHSQLPFELYGAIAEQFHPAEPSDRAQLRELSTVSRDWNTEAERVLYRHIIGVANAMLHLHFLESVGLRSRALLVQTYQADFTFWNWVVPDNLMRSLSRALRSFNNLKALEFVNADSQLVCLEDYPFQLEKFDWRGHRSQYVHRILTTQTQLKHLTYLGILDTSLGALKATTSLDCDWSCLPSLLRVAENITSLIWRPLPGPFQPILHFLLTLESLSSSLAKLETLEFQCFRYDQVIPLL
jgi:hypothetical protein